MNNQDAAKNQDLERSRASDIKARLLLVNVHPVFDHNLALQIEPQRDLMVCGHAVDVRDALQMIETTHPDLVVIDLFMEDAQDVQALTDFQSHYPGLPVIIVSIHDEMLHAETALHCGVRGYVMIGESVDYILGAIREVLHGGLAFSHNVTQRLLQQAMQNPMDQTLRPLDRLTGRESEILTLIGQGISTRKIGENLQISIKTVQAHRENIKEKLELKDGLSLTLFAVHWLDSENRSRLARSDYFGKTPSSFREKRIEAPLKKAEST